MMTSLKGILKFQSYFYIERSFISLPYIYRRYTICSSNEKQFKSSFDSQYHSENRCYCSGQVLNKQLRIRDGNDKLENTTKSISCLYVPSDKRSVFCSVLDPYLDFDKHSNDIEPLATELQKRGLESKFNKKKLIYLKENWKTFMEILNNRKNIERKVKSLQSRLKDLSLNGDSSSEEIEIQKVETKREVKKLKRTIKNYSIKEYEDEFIPFLLDLPNNLNPSTPIDDDKILSSYLDKPSFNFAPLTHVELGKINKNIELSEVSPGAYYLMKDLAEIELALEDYFVEFFHSQNYTHHSNPDLNKGVSTEGCGFDIHDRNDVLKILYQRENTDITPLFLMGGCSLPSFTAYFAKRIVGKTEKFLPQKLFATGRLYRPLQCASDGTLLSASIFNSMQSSAVSAFIAYNRDSISEENITKDISNLLQKAYKNLGVHFRIVHKSARNLKKNESAAYSIEMFSTTMNIELLNETSNLGNYIEVGRISIIGDYISKRLLMLHTTDSQVNTNTFNPSLDFMNVIYVKVIDISKFIAVLVENNQSKDGTYSVPSVLNQHLLH